MKIIIFIAFLTYSIGCCAQLDIHAQYFKNKYSEAYYNIKSDAQDKWDDNYSMIEFEINQQCDALYEISQLIDKGGYDIKLLLKCINKWSKDSQVNHNTAIMKNSAAVGKFDNNSILLMVYALKSNWMMAIFEYNQQINSKRNIE